VVFLSFLIFPVLGGIFIFFDFFPVLGSIFFIFFPVLVESSAPFYFYFLQFLKSITRKPITKIFKISS